MENEITVEVRPGSVVTALIGEADGHFLIWHLPRDDNGKPLADVKNGLVIRVVERVDN